MGITITFNHSSNINRKQKRTMKKILLGTVGACLAVVGIVAPAQADTLTTTPSVVSVVNGACDTPGYIQLSVPTEDHTYWVINGSPVTVTAADDKIEYPAGADTVAYATTDPGYDYPAGTQTSFPFTISAQPASEDCDDSARYTTDVEGGTVAPQAPVETNYATETADANSVPELAAGSEAAGRKAVQTCDNYRKSVNTTQYLTAPNGPSATGNGTDTHRFNMKFWVNYQKCTGTTDQGPKVYVLSLDLRMSNAHNCKIGVQGYWVCNGADGNDTPTVLTKRADGFQDVKMNPNVIGEWNPTTRTWTLDGTKDSTDIHITNQTQTAIYSWDTSSKRCIGADLKVEIGGLSNDWNGYSKSLCVI